MQKVMTSLAAMLVAVNGAPAQAADIRWDRWAVPHIAGSSETDAMRAFGWTQMAAHADLVLELYARARGTSAELKGEDALAADILTHQLNLPSLAGDWYRKLPAADRELLDAFVDGMNDYVRAHPEKISAANSALLPIRGTDPLAHIHQVVHRFFIADSTIRKVRNEAKALPDPVDRTTGAQNGSNGYAIAPSRSADGHAMLLANPHLPWSDHFTWFEAHLKHPSANAYGVALVGMPFLGIAFSEHGGWTHTVNFFDGADAYRLKLDGDRYRFGGAWKQLDARAVDIRVRLPDGRFRTEKLIVSSSVHGPLIERKGSTGIALRIAGLDSHGMLRQYWDMAAARNIDAFEAATSRMQVPYYNTLYASRRGDIYYLYGGRFPRRQTGDHSFWSGIIPGDRPEFVWTDYLDYDQTPHFRNPPGGFIQNANDPPWLTIMPQVLRPADFAPDVVASYDMDWRAQFSLQQLLSKPKVSFDDLADIQRQNRLGFADRILDDLFMAAESEDDALVKEAVRVLKAWDRTTGNASRGAILFIEWGNRIGMDKPRELFSSQWTIDRWDTTPDGLANPALAVVRLREAAEAVKARYGSLDIAFGDAVRLRSGAVDIAASGGPTHFGSFRAAWFVPDKDGKNRVIGGDTFVATVSFGPRLRARGLLPYGNLSRPVGDDSGQLALFAEGRLREISYYDDAVEAATVRRETID